MKKIKFIVHIIVNLPTKKDHIQQTHNVVYLEASEVKVHMERPAAKNGQTMFQNNKDRLLPLLLIRISDDVKLSLDKKAHNRITNYYRSMTMPKTKIKLQ